MALVCVTQPTADPVSIADFKVHSRIIGDAEDNYLAALITAAAGRLETLTRRRLVAQTWDLKLDRFSRIRLPWPPCLGVSSIAYRDTAGDLQTLDADDYVVDLASEPARIVPAYGVAWPSTWWEPNAVTVRFVCGFAAPITANPITGFITATGGRTFTDGEVLRLTTTDADLPAPLAARTDYYVVSASGATCKLALAAGGSAIELTDAGSGTHFAGEVPEGIKHAIRMLAGHWYEHREDAITGTIVARMPEAVESLAWQHRIDL